MYHVSLPQRGFFDVWRDNARRFLVNHVPPDKIVWDRSGDEGLFTGTAAPGMDGPTDVTVTRSFLKAAASVLCHTQANAPALLYEALYRHQTDRRALTNPADPLSRKLARLQKAVGRDVHKMHAFVRFRELPSDGPRRRFGAWFEPDHLILEIATPFFARRFADMDWAIATPTGVARFEEGILSFHPPAERPDLPEDTSEALWGTYFSNIFNPARLHLQAMRSEMPLKYWKNLPETRLIPDMLADAESRVAAMHAAMPTRAPARAERILNRLSVPEISALPQTMDDARDAASRCRRCDLCEAATQTVWGEGDPSAPLMIVGEQPGDNEDIAGRPFIGPAGQLLTQLIRDAGIGPVWKTNAVKHFKFRPRGKRRIHQSPDRNEIEHCRWWLDLERRLVKPKLALALGATAAYALTGTDLPLRARRGEIETALDGGAVMVSWHPSHILRLSGNAASRARSELLTDLHAAGAIAGKAEPSSALTQRINSD
ncbi:UdgX family uracil-DNA binding protein [Sedimentitalea sp. XS_ASV28]|uniref:UdgX family uracil-DNA binding protein n=1 Tax=Sedimentitalea sp. XS_ASV28 TaxID=3241296 RepID=UPI003517D045